MALAVALVLIAVAAVAFQFLSPWWQTPLASNWKLLDDTLMITMWICGIVFVAINVFIAYAVVRFRNRPGHKAAYEPHNRKLEWQLTLATTAGVVAMLAPGLWVYADMISPPPDSLVVEVVGQQWRWRYRLPGEDGKLGLSDVRYVKPDNPFGLNPNDPNGKDDVLIDAPELHLPQGKPVKVLQRSLDVLHNFYVPNFRMKMDLVPGQVSQFWFTPMQAGRFEVLCAEYCGLAHSNMRAAIVVEAPEAYAKWVAAQTTFAQAAAKSAAPAGGGDLLAQGRSLAQSRGCLACHNLDGKPSVGPTWKDLYGKTRPLVGGATAKVDDEYLKKSIVEPNAQVVQGYQPIMPPSQMTDQEIAAIIAVIKDASGVAVPAGPGAPPAGAPPAGAPPAGAPAPGAAPGAGAAPAPTATAGGDLVAQGRHLAQSRGCVACHSLDGKPGVGPTWKDLYGKTRPLVGGASVKVDDEYLKKSIVEPNAQVVQGYQPIMPPSPMTDQEIAAIIAVIKDASGAAAAAAPATR